MFVRFLSVIVRHPGITLLLALLATVVSLYGTTRLRFDDRVRDLLESTDGEFEQLREFMNSFGSDDNDCLIVLEAEDIVTPERIGRLVRFDEEIKRLDGVESTYSLLDLRRTWNVGRYLPLLIPRDGDPDQYARARQEALEHPLAAGQLLSEDGRTTLMIVRLAGESLDVDTMRTQLAALRERADQLEADSDLQAQLTGFPALRVDIVGRIQRDQLIFTSLTLMLSAVTAWFFFRGATAVLIAGIGPLVGLLWTMGLLGWMGEAITPVTSIVPPIVLVVGFTDAVHVVMHLRRSLADGSPRQHAAEAAVIDLWRPCGLTSATSAFGFGSLMVTGLDAICKFGMACAVGAVCSYVAVMWLTPALAATRLGDFLVDRRLSAGRPSAVDGLLHRLLAIVSRHRRLVSVVGAALTIAATPCWFLLAPDNRVGEFLPPDSESYQALLACEAAFGGALFVHVVVDWPDGASPLAPEFQRCLRDVHRILDEGPTTHRPVSLVSVLESLPGRNNNGAEKRRWLKRTPAEAIERFVRFDQRRAVVSAHVCDLGGAAHEPHFRHIEQRLAELERQHPGYRLWLTGSAIVSYRTANHMIQELARSLGLAALLIFVSMSLSLGSLRLGLISILANVLPLVGAAAFLVLLQWPLQYTSVMVFSVCIALAVDDTIHFLTRFQQQQRTNSRSRAVQFSMARVGAALIVTTIVLWSGFASLLMANMPPIRLFGGLSCLVLLLALVADLIMLPALLLWLGPEQRPSPHGLQKTNEPGETASECNTIPVRASMNAAP